MERVLSTKKRKWVTLRLRHGGTGSSPLRNLETRIKSFFQKSDLLKEKEKTLIIWVGISSNFRKTPDPLRR